MTDEEIAEESLISYRKEPKWAGKMFMQDENTCYKDGFLACATSREERIAELEKENKELKEKVGKYQIGMFDEIEKRDKQLTKAKEIITNLVKFDGGYKNDEEYQCKSELYDKICEEAEQFLKEAE